MRPKWWSFSAALLLILSVLVAVGYSATGARDAHGVACAGEVALAELPREVRETLRLIRQGGPFPHRRDGSVFFNREQRLPVRPRGYYSEYTVRTPGSRDRGARRIVAGRGAAGDPASSGEYYYTDDHYETFCRIRE
jgi:ribonuclease T1